MYIYTIFCPGRHGESCFTYEICLHPQNCDYGFCDCPLNTTFALYYFAGIIASEKCISNDSKSFCAHALITHDILITHILLVI